MRRVVVCLGVAVVLMVGWVATAEAGVIGQTGGNAGCGGDQLLVQTASTGVSYVILAAGIVTSWSFAGGTSGASEALVILRPTGGGNYTVVGSAAAETVAASDIGVFAANIAVEAGDLVGEWIPSSGSNSCALITTGSDFLDHDFGIATLPAAGDSVALFAVPGYVLNMSVVLDDPADDQVNRGGYCSVAGNRAADGTPIAPGTFLDLASDQPSNDSLYTGATPAYFYEGKGLSCDSLPGYTKTGELVGFGGHGDAGGYTYMAKV
jgi:hypothetical protein